MDMHAANDFYEILAADQPTPPRDQAPRDLEAKAGAMAVKLGEADLVEASALMARLTSQLLRQEKMLQEERARAAALELQLATYVARNA